MTAHDFSYLLKKIESLDAKIDHVAKQGTKIALIDSQCKAIGKILLGILTELRGENPQHAEAIRKDTAVNTASPYIPKP